MCVKMKKHKLQEQACICEGTIILAFRHGSPPFHGLGGLTRQTLQKPYKINHSICGSRHGESPKKEGP